MRNKKAKALRKHVKGLLKEGEEKSVTTTYIGGRHPSYKQIPDSLLFKKVTFGTPTQVSDKCVRFYTQGFKKHVKKFGVVEASG